MYKTNKGCRAILLNPPFLFVPSCLEQITACPHILAPQGAFYAVQVLWPGGQAGGPGHIGEEEDSGCICFPLKRITGPDGHD